MSTQNRAVSLRTLAILAAVLAAAGCATAPKRQFSYPPPPDKARVEYVRSIRRPDDLRTGFLQRVVAALVPYSSDTQIYNPTGIALSPDDRFIYVALSETKRVVKIDLESGRFEALGMGGDRPLASPVGLAVDAEGKLYVGDKGQGAVVVYDATGTKVVKLIRDKLKFPTAIAIDRAAQLLYVVNDSVTQDGRHTIETFSLAGEHLRTLGGGKGTPDGMFVFPSNVAVSPEGELFVADMLNFRIQVFDREGRFMRKFGEPGRGGAGAFDKIHGIAFDTFGNIYVADALQGIQILNRNAQGLMGFGGGALGIPMFIAIDKRNHIFVTDLQEGLVEFRLVNTSAEDSNPSPVSAPVSAPGAPSEGPSAPAPNSAAP